MARNLARSTNLRNAYKIFVGKNLNRICLFLELDRRRVYGMVMLMLMMMMMMMMMHYSYSLDLLRVRVTKEYTVIGYY